MEKSNKKVEILKQIKDSLEKENNELKTNLEEKFIDVKEDEDKVTEVEEGHSDEEEVSQNEFDSEDESRNEDIVGDDENDLDNVVDDEKEYDSVEEERPSVKEAEEDAGDKDSDDENRKKFEEEDGNEYDSVNGESETESEIKTKRRSRHNLSQSDSESEKMIDSSNDEPEAGNGDDEEDKGIEEKSVGVVEGEDEVEEEFYLDFDEDFDEQFEVEKVIVRNWYDAPETIIDYTKVPKDLSKYGSTFKATPTSLNNQLVFVATNNHVGRHNPFDKSRKSFCGLSPVCKLSWEPDREITQVLITECDNHPRLGRPVWSCRHHAVASMKGVKLQTQRYNYRNKEVEETLDLEADKDVKEMSEGLGTVDETIDEEIEVGGILVEKEKSRDEDKLTTSSDNVKNGGTGFDSESLFIIEPKKRRSLKRKRTVKATVAEVEELETKYGKNQK